MRTFAVAFLSTCFMLTHAQAADTWDFADGYKEGCSSGSMLQMNQCLADSFAHLDRRMNDLYAKLLRSLKNPKPLEESQLLWSKFRDAECRFQVPPERSGSAVPYSRNSCLIDHTVRRLRDLERISPCNGCVEFKSELYQ